MADETFVSLGTVPLVNPTYRFVPQIPAIINEPMIFSGDFVGGTYDGAGIDSWTDQSSPSLFFLIQGGIGFLPDPNNRSAQTLNLRGFISNRDDVRRDINFRPLSSHIGGAWEYTLRVSVHRDFGGNISLRAITNFNLGSVRHPYYL